MDYNDYLKKAREVLGNCFACTICDGKACLNHLPGPGAKGKGEVAINNYAAWQSIKVVMDTISDVKDVDTSTTLFNTKFKAPIFAGPVGAVKMHYSDLYDDITYNQKLIKECAENEIAAFSGDGIDDQMMVDSCKIIKQNHGVGIPTIKPWSLEKIKEKMQFANESNAIAIAMDIDAAGLPFLQNLNPPAGTKSVEELREIRSYTNSEFIVKGIMSTKGALKALEAKASCIIVSNHGGRVLDDCEPTANVLEDIVKAVNGNMKILVDGGIRSGSDIFKALALGADGVLIARPFVVSTYGDFNKLYIDKLCNELKDTMKMCGAKDIKSIKRDMIKKQDN